MLHVTRDKSRGKVASRAIYLEIDKPRAEERERKGLRERGHKETGLREGAIKGRLNAKQTNVEFGPSARNSISDSKGKARGECRVGAWQLLISRLNLKLSANLFMRR